MRRLFSIICLIIPLCGIVSAQVFTDSNLPIVVITTDQGVAIPDDPKVLATMKIIYRGPEQRNYLTDQNNPAFLDYNGRIKIEIRGSSSQSSPKKQYAFTTLMPDNITNNNTSLLGMPEENDWIINGMVFDPGLIRDYLSYNLSRQIGQYASRTAYCEVVINGSFMGLYVLQEKIKADDNRVDVLKIETDDIQFPEVTGGYITKADKTTGGDPVAWKMLTWTGALVEYIHEMPKPEDVRTAQTNYIHNQFIMLDAAASQGNISLVDGIPSVIDIPSFIDYMIVNELGSGADSYTYSAFFHKDRNGKLRAGPVWDMDLTYGNDLFFWGYDRSKTNVWQFSDGENDGSRFWKDLFNNDSFRCYLSRRWNELIQPGQPLNLTVISSFIDQTASAISEAAARNYSKWGTAGTFQGNISSIKSFLATRINWITSNIGSFSACADVTLPPLVINRIMYHPATSFEFPEAEDLEFVEIMNNGDQSVDLTGIYFGGTGFVFQFPPYTLLGPRASAVIASNGEIFREKYGIPASGQFTRQLSNKSEELVLLDGFGNVIDRVVYSDTVPWPEADGNGHYLALKDPDLDNSLPENWIASDDIIVSDYNIGAGPDIVFYPNPVSEILNINSGSEIQTISLYDIYGRLLLRVNVENERYGLNMSHFPRGIYIIRANIAGKTIIEKIIKE